MLFQIDVICCRQHRRYIDVTLEMISSCKSWIQLSGTLILLFKILRAAFLVQIVIDTNLNIAFCLFLFKTG